MANTYSANVAVVDTTGYVAPAGTIIGIKYIAGTSSSATLKSDGTSGGTVIWQDSGATGYDRVKIRDRDGFYVTLGGTGAKLYIYYE